MKTIILPGYSKYNKNWADDISEKLSDKGIKSIVHNWRHWETEGSLSIKYETEKIIEEIGKDEVNIIAKSVGTMMVLKMLPKIRNQIRKIILCGIPSTSEVRRKLFLESIKNFPSEKIICIQNTKDPFASFIELKNFMKSIDSRIKVIEKTGTDHNYPYFEDFLAFLTD